MLWLIVICKRLLWALPTLLAVSIIGFTLMRYDVDLGVWPVPALKNGGVVIEQTHIHFKNPIDPLAELKNNPQITPAVYESEKKRLGLDRPFHEQYLRWLSHLFEVNDGVWQPNMGKSFSGEDVFTQLKIRAGNTLLLNCIVILLTWLIALPLGVFGALRWRSTTDRLLTLLASVGMAAPSFVVALVLAVVCVKFRLLPVGGLTSINHGLLPWWQQIGDVAAHLVLPVVVLMIGGLASLQRQMRGNLLDVLQAEYVRMARAKGLPEHKVVYKHAVRTAINPLVTLLGYELAALLSGSLLVEMILNYPGLGQYTYQAVLQTDTNVVMASLVLSATLLVAGNVMADLLLTVVDPRISLSAIEQRG